MKYNVKLGDGGLNFFDLLTLVFITLKLCGVINWNWLLVLTPGIAELVVIIVVAIVVRKMNR